MPAFFDELLGKRQRYQDSPLGQLDRIVGDARSAGFFSPHGSDLIRRQVRAHALRTARNRIGRGGVLSRIMGLDPQQARAAQLGFEQGAGEDISNALNQSDLEQGLGNQAFFRQLFGGQLDFQRQQMLQEQAEKAARKAAGSPLGQLAGQVVGAVIPGLSFGGGRGGGGGGYRPPRMGEPGFRF